MVTKIILPKDVDPDDKHKIKILLKLENTVARLQLWKINGLSDQEKTQLYRTSGLIIRDLIYEIIKLRGEPTSIPYITQKLLNIKDNFLASTGYLEKLTKYLDKASEIMNTKITPKEFVIDLLEVRGKKRNTEKMFSQLLSPSYGHSRFKKIDDDLFAIKEWPKKKYLQIYVQLATKYRVINPEKKEKYIEKAIKLLESRKIQIENKKEMIKTLKNM